MCWLLVFQSPVWSSVQQSPCVVHVVLSVAQFLASSFGLEADVLFEQLVFLVKQQLVYFGRCLVYVPNQRAPLCAVEGAVMEREVQ